MNIFSKRNNYEDERYNQNYSNDSSKISEWLRTLYDIIHPFLENIINSWLSWYQSFGYSVYGTNT